MKYELGRYTNMNKYRIWSKDIGMDTFDDGDTISALGADFAVEDWLDARWSDFDQPSPPIKFNVQHVDDDDKPIGPIMKFDFDAVDYSPNFYVYLDDEEIPTTTETKTTS